MLIRNICSLSLVIVIVHIAHSNKKVPEECQLWSNFNVLSVPELDCKRNDECTGVNCTNIILDYKFKFGLWLEHCKDPIKVVVLVDAPVIDLINWRQEFEDGVKVKIPGLELNDNSFYLRFDIQRTNDKKYVTLAVNFLMKVEALSIVNWASFHPRYESGKLPVPQCHNGKPVTYLPPPPATTVRPTTQHSNDSHHYHNECDTRDLFSCMEHAMCKQLNASSHKGKCVCYEGYHFDAAARHCLNKTADNHHPAAPRKTNQQFDYTIVIATVVPIVCLLLCATVAFLSVRFRWWQRVRSRFQVRVYDQILIGGPQDVEDDDPVA